MTLLGGGSSASRPFPSGRYARTDPLRREFGLRLLAEPLPEPLRTTLIRAWRRPAHFDGKQAIQSLHRQRPDEASFPLMNVSLLGADFADRTGSLAAHRRNPANQHQPRDAQQAAQGAERLSAVSVYGAGRKAGRGSRAGCVRGPGAEGRLAPGQCIGG